MLLSVGDRTLYYLILRNVWDDDDSLYDKIYSPSFADHQRRWTCAHISSAISQHDEVPMPLPGHALRVERETRGRPDLAGGPHDMANSLESRAPLP